MKHHILLIVLALLSPIANGQIAPNFMITDAAGIEHNLYEDYLDQGKTVVVKMFFVDCPLCKPYNEPFQNLYEDLGSGQDSVEFLLLTTKPWDSNEDVQVYLQQFGLGFPGSGNDGGGYDATAPYRNGDFGVFFGSPSFVLMEPNRTVHLDLNGGGVSETMQRIKDRVEEIRNGTSQVESTTVNVEVKGYGDKSLPDYTLRLRSSNNKDSSYIVSSSFIYPSAELPLLSDPEIIIETQDLSHSGVTTIDIVTIQRYILGIVSFDPFQILASDVNGSGSVTPSDLLSMRKVILSLKDGFDVQRSWLSLDSRCTENSSFCKESISIDPSVPEQSFEFTMIKYGDVK